MKIHKKTYYTASSSKASLDTIIVVGISGRGHACASSCIWAHDSSRPVEMLHDLPLEAQPAAVEVLAAAFEHYPPFVYICEGSGTDTRDFLRWMFERYLRAVLCVPGARVLCDAEGRRTGPSIISLILPPSSHDGAGARGSSSSSGGGLGLGCQDVSVWSLLWFGLWELPLRFGFGCLRRTLSVLQGIEDAEKLITQQVGAFWFQDYLCTDPRLQNRGLGGEALEDSIANVMQVGVGGVSGDGTAVQLKQMPILLNTFSEKARRFYRDHGFEEIGSLKVGGRVLGCWVAGSLGLLAAPARVCCNALCHALKVVQA